MKDIPILLFALLWTTMGANANAYEKDFAIMKQMITSADQLSSPYSDYEEGQHIEYLIDGDKSTFWHTDWHNQSPEGMYYKGIECHYLQISGMENLVGNCVMYLCQRSCANDHPSKLVLLGTDNLSDNGGDEEWSEIAVLEIPYTGSGEENYIPFIVEKAYPYVRVLVFDCIGTSVGFHKFWHAAEIQFFHSQSKEYDAALAAVKNDSYYIVTEIDDIKYYVSRQGELKAMSELENNVEDGLFEISQVSGGTLFTVGWLIEANTGGHFSNTTLIDNLANLHPGTGVFRLDNSNNRNDWERQVFFMNEEGKIAIRSCNTVYGTSGWYDAGRAFWRYEIDEVGNPVYIDDFVGLIPCYSYEPAYVWMLEQSSIVNNKVLIDGIGYYVDNEGITAEVASLPDNVKYSGNVVIPLSICYNGKTYSVTRINSWAFNGCYNLTSVTIPNSVTNIANNAFYGCDQLKDIYCLAENVPETSNYAFNNSPIGSATLHVPVGLVDSYRATLPWSSFGSIVSLTSPIDEVVDEADWMLLKLAYTEMNGGEGWNRKWIFDDESHSLLGLGGITLNHGRVTSIDLSSNNLTGTFPYTLLLLSELKAINLSHNNLTGDIGLTMAAFKQKNSSKTFAIQKLDISDNKFSGNIGLFANCFDNLETLYASNNCFEDVYPMIPTTVTTLDLSNQTISRVVPLHLAKLSVADIASKVPSILLYDHANQTFTSNINLMCSTKDNRWSMMMAYQNGQLSVPYVSNQNTYYGETGDTLNVSVYNKGIPEGSTFRISLSFDEGDGNFDGQVNVLDLQAMINYMFEEYENKPYNFTASNLWKDEVINVQDAVSLVNILLANNSAPVSARASYKECRLTAMSLDNDAIVFIADGKLIMNAAEPVSSFDIVVATDSEFKLDEALASAGFNCSVRNSGNETHIVGYSLSGATLPAGQNILGTLNDGVVIYSMLADTEANEVTTPFGSTTTGIYSVTSNTQRLIEVYRISLDAKRSIVIDANGKKYMITE